MGEFEVNDEDGPDRDPDPTDLDRWRERQQALNEVYAQGTNAVDGDQATQLEAITRSLAELLWSFHDDRPLWQQLRKQQVTLDRLDEERRIRILAATDIDWVPFLLQAGYRPPPPDVGKLADEFRMDIRRAINDRRDLDIRGLRKRVADLATRLDQALADERPGRVAKIRSSLRAALPVAGRAALVNGVAAATGAGAAVFIAATGLAPFAPIALAAAGGATRAALDRAVPKWGNPAEGGLLAAGPGSIEVSRLIRDRLRPDTAGVHAATLELLGAAAEHSPPGTSMLVVVHEAGLEEAFRDSLDWIDRTLGAVFVGWEDAARANMPTANLAHLADRLCRARRVLADLGVNEPRLQELANDINRYLIDVLTELPPDHGH